MPGETAYDTFAGRIPKVDPRQDQSFEETYPYKVSVLPRLHAPSHLIRLSILCQSARYIDTSHHHDQHHIFPHGSSSSRIVHSSCTYFARASI
jgi:hypothetical protein